ncbi:unnamed protein product, partial [Cuscuta campestris]
MGNGLDVLGVYNRCSLYASTGE